MKNKIKVVYLLGEQRSGSTILQRILGQHDGFFPAGELWFIWERGVHENWLCGCGTPFQQCPYWVSVFESGFGGMQHVDSKAMQEAISLSSRTRHFPLYWLKRYQHQVARQIGSRLETIRRLYKAIQDSADVRVIIDSSKNPGYANLLSMIPEIDLYLIHLIRDPRAVAYSRQRTKVQVDTDKRNSMVKMNPFKSASMWTLWNATAERLRASFPDKYIQIRYEDFMAQPREGTQKLLNMIGEPTAASPFVDENRVLLKPSHTVAGNTNRFQSGEVKLLSDEIWKREMSRHQKFLVALLTKPLMNRYGYI